MKNGYLQILWDRLLDSQDAGDMTDLGMCAVGLMLTALPASSR